MGEPMLGAKALPVHPTGLVFGVVVRPPHYRWDGLRLVSDRLIAVDDKALTALDDSLQVVIEGDFVAVVAKSFTLARQAAERLALRWEPALASESESDAIRTFGHTPPQSVSSEHVDNEHVSREHVSREYAWPSRLRWGDAPGWVVAEHNDAMLRVWTHTATPEALRLDLSRATGRAPGEILIEGPEHHFATGLGRHSGDDAAVDAALMANALGRPVAVWLDAGYMGDVQALGQAQRMTLAAGFDAHAPIADYRYRQAYPRGEVAAVGLLLSGRAACGEGIDCAAPLHSPYTFDETRLAAHTGVRDGARDELAEVQETFAREAFLDELARARGDDALALRLSHLEDERGRALLENVARRAGWGAALGSDPASELARGRGLAYAQLPDRHDRMESGVRSAWIAEVDVNRITGEVRLTRLVVGQDSGAEVDTARLQSSLQTRLLGRAPAFDEWGDGGEVPPAALPATTGTALKSETPAPPSEDSARVSPGFDEAALAPGVAVIANALFDATGVRFREPPFTATRVRRALAQAVPGQKAGGAGASVTFKGRRWLTAAALTTVAGSAVMAWPWKGAIAPIARPAATLYSADTIERGRLVAAAGDCAACHTVAGGATNAGGHAFDTPFGTLYSTNITPDEATGIGRWSYAAFERAMRQGIGRDGRHLYPAFPYTAFAKTSDADLQALYAYLMAQPAVSAPPRDNALSFPFNQRALIAPWNALYHDPTPFTPDPAQSELYNRGAYLAEGLGHCSACHSPRNAMGAEQGGERYLAGALVDGWEAPALNTLSRAPIPWSEGALFDYLRTGRADLHGVASGPMAPVVAGLAELPEYDVRAIAHYVARQMDAPVQDDPASAVASERLAAETGPAGQEAGERLFEGACAACHVDNGVPGFTKASTSLALNTNLHSDHPDNVIQSILGGVHDSAVPGTGSMPGFADSFSNTQVATLAAYLRARFAPEAQPWQQLEQRVAEIRRPH
ncbi:c-type cytochrome [Halomonas sp. 707D4]|uniref:c-type cytochrome n=1 Tax=Halomonas sp. 707D4 TaxID=1904455 RepID=UPI00209CD18B|nr:c-type cytochrome [Halomonas sp. 707D4]MCP1325575.1 molybdopterin-dependent oxidoreductase [Halomonas sp. 707D4]